MLNADLAAESPAPGDADLIERFVVARDEAAFAELVHRHSSIVLGVCRRVLRDTHDIDDVFQATFLVLVRDAARIRKRKSIASWLYGVAFRLSVRMAREKIRRRETVLVDETLIGDDTFQKLVERHDQQQVDVELNAISERYRQPLVLRFLAGKSTTEVAIELGLTVGAVEGLIKRGKHELHARLLRRGITLGAALVALEATQKAAQAVGSTALIDTTIQASLAWSVGTHTILPGLVSLRAIELAGKEALAMTTMTKTALAVGLSVGGLVIGIGGSQFLSTRAGGQAEAAGLVSNYTVAHSIEDGIEVATVGADPQDNPKQEAVTEPVATTGTTAGETGNVAGTTGTEQAPTTNPRPKLSRPRTQWDARFRNALIQKMENELHNPTEVRFVDIPLKDGLDYLEDLHQIKIWIDKNALSDAGVSIDQTITLEVAGISLKSALNKILGPCTLDYIIRDDVMEITTREITDHTYDTRVYNIGLLPDLKAKELIDIITATIEPDCWNSVQPSTEANKEAVKTTPAAKSVAGSTSTTSGGTDTSTGKFAGGGAGAVDSALGSIRATNKTLVIRQTPRIHELIVDLLEQLKTGN